MRLTPSLSGSAAPHERAHHVGLELARRPSLPYLLVEPGAHERRGEAMRAAAMTSSPERFRKTCAKMARANVHEGALIRPRDAKQASRRVRRDRPGVPVRHVDRTAPAATRFTASSATASRIGARSTAAESLVERSALAHELRTAIHAEDEGTVHRVDPGLVYRRNAENPSCTLGLRGHRRDRRQSPCCQGGPVRRDRRRRRRAAPAEGRDALFRKTSFPCSAESTTSVSKATVPEIAFAILPPRSD